jgi:hypothetical protein
MCSLFFLRNSLNVSWLLVWSCNEEPRTHHAMERLLVAFLGSGKLWSTRWILLTPPPPLPPHTCPRVPSINLQDFVLLSRTRSTRHQKSSVGGLLQPKLVSESATKKIQFSCYPFISFFSLSSLVLCDIGRDLCEFCKLVLIWLWRADLRVWCSWRSRSYESFVNFLNFIRWFISLPGQRSSVAASRLSQIIRILTAELRYNKAHMWTPIYQRQEAATCRDANILRRGRDRQRAVDGKVQRIGDIEVIVAEGRRSQARTASKDTILGSVQGSGDSSRGN